MRPLLQPCKNLLAMLQHSMLDIDLVRLITGKGGIKSSQCSGLLRLHNLVFVEKIAFGALFPEKKPILAASPGRQAFLEKRSERSDARSRTDHNNRSGWIFR